MHNQTGMIFSMFEHMFPSLSKGVEHYGPWAEHSIRIEITGENVLIFEYHTPKNWMLCTSENEWLRLEEKEKSRQKQVL